MERRRNRAKLTTAIAMILLLICCAACAMADSGTIGDGIYWTMEDGVLTITGSGAIPNYSYRDTKPWGSQGRIKKVILSEGITRIGNNVFYNESGITEMEIPETVTEIGESAFFNMSAWTISHLPDGISKIGNYAFYKANLSNVQELPAGCTEMGAQAFEQCGLSGKVILPNGLKSIGTDCFAQNEITEVVLPSGITTIPMGAFAENQLTTLTIPEGVTVIDSNAFDNNHITALSLPSTLRTIGMFAFRNNTELQEITLPDGIESIYQSAFEATSLMAVEIPSSVTYMDFGFDKSVLLAVIKGSTADTAIQSNYNYYTVAYLDNANLQTRTISQTDKTCAIIGYTGTETMLAIPKELNGYKVTAIGDNAFSNNRRLQAVMLPYTVTSIGKAAFRSCDNLAKINLPSGLQEVGEEAFSFDSKLEMNTEDFPDSLKKIGAYAFSSTKLQGTLHYGNEWTIGEGAFDLTWIWEVYIDDDVTAIPDGLFYGMGQLTDLHLPENLQKVGDRAFEQCGQLASIDLPDTVTEIGEYAFAYCIGLTTFDFPEGVTEIKAGTFSECSGMTFIDIPERITKIGASAFSACTGLTEVTLPDGITEIADYTFDGCSGLTAVHYPESLTSIGYAAFAGCDALTAFTLDCSIQVAEFAFGSALHELTVSGSGAVTAAWAEPVGISLEGCTAITISGPETIETGALNAFTNLHSITIGDSVRTMQAGCLNAPFDDAVLTMPEALWTATCPDGTGDPFSRGVRYLFQGNQLRLNQLILVKEDGREIVVDAPLLQASPTPLPTPQGGSVSFSGTSDAMIVTVERGSRVTVNTDSLTWYMDKPNMDHFIKPSTFADYGSIFSSLGNHLTFDTTDAPSTWVITIHTYTYSTIDVKGRPGYIIGDPKGVFALTIYVKDFVIVPPTPDPTPAPPPEIQLSGGETIREIQPGSTLRLGSSYEYDYTISPDDPTMTVQEEGRTAENDLVLAVVPAQNGNYELRYTLYEREYEDAQVIWRFNYDPPKRIVVYPYKKGEKVAEGVLIIRAEALAALLLPNGIEIIGDGAFEGVDTQKVLVAATIQEIGHRAFASCPNLKEVHLPKNVTFYEDTFADNPNLVLYLPAGGTAEQKAIEYGLNYETE